KNVRAQGVKCARLPAHRSLSRRLCDATHCPRRDRSHPCRRGLTPQRIIFAACNLEVAELAWNFCGDHGAAIVPLLRDYGFVLDKTKGSLQQASRANSLTRVSGDLCAALAANVVGGLHLIDWPSAPSIT